MKSFGQHSIKCLTRMKEDKTKQEYRLVVKQRQNLARVPCPVSSLNLSRSIVTLMNWFFSTYVPSHPSDHHLMECTVAITLRDHYTWKTEKQFSIVVFYCSCETWYFVYIHSFLINFIHFCLYILITSYYLYI